MVASEPITAVGNAISSLTDYFTEKKKSKYKKKELKETKRKTFADLLNEALGRSHDSAKDARRSQNDLAIARANALQNMAANYRTRG